MTPVGSILHRPAPVTCTHVNPGTYSIATGKHSVVTIVFKLFFVDGSCFLHFMFQVATAAAVASRACLVLRSQAPHHRIHNVNNGSKNNDIN